jgi:DME family drug/metabolite transporter
MTSSASPPLPLDYESPPQGESPPQRRSFGVAMLIVAAILWSVSGIAVKLAAHPLPDGTHRAMDPFAFALYRSLFAALAMLPLLPLGRGNVPKLLPMLASVALSASVYALLILSMTVSTSGTGILLQYTGPIFCALFAWLFQNRTIGGRTVLAMAIATSGIIVMIAGNVAVTPSGAAPTLQLPTWVGPVAGLLSGVAFGGLILVLERVDRSAGGVNPYVVVLINNGGTALLLAPLCLWQGTLTDVTARQILVVALTGAFQLAIPYVLFQLALRRVKPVDASLLILLEPVLNPVWIAIFADEVPRIGTIIGGAALLVAMIIEAVNPRPKDVTSH